MKEINKRTKLSRCVVLCLSALYCNGVAADSGDTAAASPAIAVTAPAPKTGLSCEAMTEEMRVHELALQRLKQEKELLTLNNALLAEKNRRKLAELTAQRDKLLLENEIKEAERTQLLADLTVLKEKLELENTIREARRQKSVAELDAEKARLELENTLLEAKNRKEQLEIEMETSRLGLKTARMEYEKSLKNRNMEELDEKIAERTKWEEWEGFADKKPEYLKDPFVDGKLTISDRRILLDSPIMPGVGDYITERINFYNNKNDQYPIFLIIDRCTGGSVLEGAQILKAMQSSDAPVYVVVRSFAASMAAVLTALADRSFAYPNAVLVHHQISALVFGNMTQQRERLDTTEDWARRVMLPVAEKMGLTLEEFVEQMYAHNSDGNWHEFADGAQKVGWVDHVVSEVVDTSYLKMPVETPEEEQVLFLQQKQTDAQGQTYVKLPHLVAGDFYFMYNPDNYYRY